MLSPQVISSAPVGTSSWAAQQADLINDLHKKTAEQQVEIGELLEAVKDELGHGKFAIWVNQNCRFSVRTAQRYMERAAEARGEVKPKKEKAPEPVVASDEVVGVQTDIEGAEHDVVISVDESGAEKVTSFVELATSSKSAEHYTPPVIVDLMFELYDGAPSLDPASCEKAQKVVGAKKFFTKDDDGLSKNWEGQVFLNWPGGRDEAIKWARKLVDEYKCGRVFEAVVVLFRHDHTTEWWDVLVEAGADACLVRDRIVFWNDERPLERGDRAGGAPHPSSIAYLGKRHDRFADVFSDLGPVIPNRFFT